MPAGDDAAPPARRRGDTWTRLLRSDCTTVPKATAEKWLREFGDVVRIVGRKIQRHNPLTARLDFEDIISVGRFAILEACQTYDPKHGGSLRTWVGNVVHWRMSEAVQRLARPIGEILDHDQAQHRYEATCVDEFEERQESAEQLAILASHFAQLPHRTRLIMTQRLEGIESEEIARSLGISTFREQQIVMRSRAWLRASLAVTITDPEQVLGTSDV